MSASSVKPKPKKANKVEVASDEPTKGEAQVNATTPTTPPPKPKAQPKGNAQTARKEARVVVKVNVESRNPEWTRGNSSVSISLNDFFISAFVNVQRYQ